VTTYRIFPATSGPGAPTAASGGWLLGVIFSCTGAVSWLNGYYHWVPAGGDTVARKFALWNRYSTTQQNLVTGSVVTSGTMTAGQWNFVALGTPIQLAPGALYVAAAGWTATNGIPVTSAQFGSGDPFAAGIVNGPLTAWSATSGSNTFPAGTTNYGLGQMLFSNALGADPSVAMPNNGSGDDNLWVDVQISDTAPVGYSGTYRFYPNMADLGNYSLDTANNFTLGMQFSVSQACTVNNVWFYSPATVTQLPTGIGIYDAAGPTLIASNNSPSWSGAAGSGWVSAALTGTLQAGKNYKVCVVNGAGVPAIWNAAVASYWSTGFGTAGLTAGPLTAPNNAGALAPGQDTYNAGAALTYPLTNVGPYSYGVDIEVTIAPPAPAAVAVAVAGGDENRQTALKKLDWLLLYLYVCVHGRCISGTLIRACGMSLSLPRSSGNSRYRPCSLR
jgi:uncharacterized protein DUF4082